MSQIVTVEGFAWRATPLREEHAEPLARLYEDSADYLELVQAGPPASARVQRAFTSLPEAKTYEDRFAFVIADSELPDR